MLWKVTGKLGVEGWKLTNNLKVVSSNLAPASKSKPLIFHKDQRLFAICAPLSTPRRNHIGIIWAEIPARFGVALWRRAPGCGQGNPLRRGESGESGSATRQPVAQFRPPAALVRGPHRERPRSLCPTSTTGLQQER